MSTSHDHEHVSWHPKGSPPTREDPSIAVGWLLWNLIRMRFPVSSHTMVNHDLLRYPTGLPLGPRKMPGGMLSNSARSLGSHGIVR